MKISILCSDKRHPVVPWLEQWKLGQIDRGNKVELVYKATDLTKGDMLFLVSCSEFVKKDIIDKFNDVLVLHASDLPLGRGWSPHIWEILNGAESIVVSMIEASDPIDSGKIWLQDRFVLDGHELLGEINALLFTSELKLMTTAVKEREKITPKKQIGHPGPYFRKRTPDDSELDPNKTIAEQFNLLRVSDSVRYPAFFKIHGHKYLLKIEKVE